MEEQGEAVVERKKQINGSGGTRHERTRQKEDRRRSRNPDLKITGQVSGESRGFQSSPCRPRSDHLKLIWGTGCRTSDGKEAAAGRQRPDSSCGGRRTARGCSERQADSSGKIRSLQILKLRSEGAMGGSNADAAADLSRDQIKESPGRKGQISVCDYRETHQR